MIAIGAVTVAMMAYRVAACWALAQLFGWAFALCTSIAYEVANTVLRRIVRAWR